MSYTVDPDDLSATHVAEQLGEAVESVFKTLILKGDRSDYFACLIPAHKEIDLKNTSSPSTLLETTI